MKETGRGSQAIPKLHRETSLSFQAWGRSVAQGSARGVHLHPLPRLRLFPESRPLCS